MEATKNTHQIEIPEEYSSTRIDLTIPKMVNTLSRNQTQKLIKKGLITRNHEAVKTNSILNAGDRLQITIPPLEKLDITPWDTPLDIVYEDDDLALINKAQGMVVHPSESYQDPTLVHALMHHLDHLSGIGGVQRPGIVHRLDKDTSGLIIVAKSDLAHKKLVEQFQNHQIKKTYLSLCYSAPQFEEKTIETQIDRNPSDRKKMISVSKGGRIAISELRVLKRFMGKHGPLGSLIEINLKTGRTHQIRVHCAEIGNSVIGDSIYGIPSQRQKKWTDLPKEIQFKINSLNGQLLHAHSLAFEHPVTKKPLSFTSPLPKVFQETIALFEKTEREIHGQADLKRIAK